MKVICIENKELYTPKEEPSPYLVVGNTYTVEKEEVDEGQLYYHLVGFNEFMYNSKGFIPCSGIDEMELINQKSLTV